MKDKDVDNFEKGGEILSEVMNAALSYAQAGMTLASLDKFIDTEICRRGGEPSFKKVPNYYWASCININEGVVHGIPGERILSRGDLISIDIGVYYKGLHTDMAYSFIAGNELSQVWQDPFLEAGRRGLERAIDAAVVGNRVGDISKAIEETVEGKGYHCVDSLTGHGVGANLHEDPYIPCVARIPIRKTPVLKQNQALAIEVIYTLDKSYLITESDGWTIVNKSGKIAALFEKTIVVNDSEAKVITPFFWEENAR